MLAIMVTLFLFFWRNILFLASWQLLQELLFSRSLRHSSRMPISSDISNALWRWPCAWKMPTSPHDQKQALSLNVYSLSVSLKPLYSMLKWNGQSGIHTRKKSCQEKKLLFKKHSIHSWLSMSFQHWINLVRKIHTVKKAVWVWTVVVVKFISRVAHFLPYCLFEYRSLRFVLVMLLH
jgi:hypothetical protein